MTHPALPTRPQFLAHGPWTLQLRGDELAEISYGGAPVLRGIRAVVRNHNWLTLTPEVSSVVARGINDEDDGGLECRVDVAWAGLGAEYRGTLTVRMDDGGIGVAFEGTAPRDFLSNRIGLVVLHRPDDAGRAVAVVHPDGTRTDAAFPGEISPHQPFKDIAALGWERDGMRFSLGFSGDVFETEDQRNWTDASFKTYSTPLSLPFPVLHEAGRRVSQSVALSAVHAVRVGAEAVARVPEIASWGDAPAGDALGPMVLEIAAAPRAGDGTVSVGEALTALDGGREADVRIVAASAGAAIGVLEGLPLGQLRRLAVFDPQTHVTSPEAFEKLAARARELGFRGELLSGARSHFTELNRTAGAVPRADGTAYSITSQMHAVEPEAVMESLRLQAATARQALAIGGGAPLHIGPITIAPRFNAVGTEAPRPEELPRRSPLESEPFGAAWLLGSVAALTVPGVASLAYARPEASDSPAAGLLRRLVELRGADVLEASTLPGGPVAYPVRGASGITCFLANPRPWAVAVEVSGPAGAGTGSPCEVTLRAWSTAAVVLS